MKNNKTIADYLSIPEGRDQAQEMIDEIMDEFDFERVHKTMEALNWQWRDEGIPDIPTLRKAARSQLKQVSISPRDKSDLDTGYFLVSSGGFEAYCVVLDIDEDEAAGDNWKNDFMHQCKLVLKFVVESWGDI